MPKKLNKFRSSMRRGGKKKRPRLRKDMIGDPRDFMHVTHGGGGDGATQGLDTTQLMELLKAVDVGPYREAAQQVCIKEEGLSQVLRGEQNQQTEPHQEDGLKQDAKMKPKINVNQDRESERDAPNIDDTGTPSRVDDHSAMSPVHRLRKSFRLKKNKRTRKLSIGSPYNFSHVSHAGFDGENNFSHFNIDKELEERLKDLLRECGLSKVERENPKTKEFVYNFLGQQNHDMDGINSLCDNNKQDCPNDQHTSRECLNMTAGAKLPVLEVNSPSQLSISTSPNPSRRTPKRRAPIPPSASSDTQTLPDQPSRDHTTHPNLPSCDHATSPCLPTCYHTTPQRDKPSHEPPTSHKTPTSNTIPNNLAITAPRLTIWDAPTPPLPRHRPFIDTP